MRRTGASVPRTVTNSVVKATIAVTSANADSTWRKSSQSYRLTASEVGRRLHRLRDRDLRGALVAGFANDDRDLLVALEELLELLGALPLVHNEHEAVAHGEAVVEATHALRLFRDRAEPVSFAREEFAEPVGVAGDADGYDNAHLWVSSCSWGAVGLSLTTREPARSPPPPAAAPGARSPLSG